MASEKAHNAVGRFHERAAQQTGRSGRGAQESHGKLREQYAEMEKYLARFSNLLRT